MPYLLSCDIHTHTMFSAHAYSTIEENVYWAAERGLQVLGSADHLSSMVTACPNDLRSYQFFINQDIWPRIWSGVLVLRGAEADIVSLDGSLFGEDTPVTLDIAGDSYSRQHSLFDLVTRNLDYLVASVHNPQIAEGATLAQTTEMYINALEHPKVFMLGHTGRSGVPFDIDEVLLAAKAKHKIIEINNHSLEHGVDTEHWAVCRKIAERCEGLPVSAESTATTAEGMIEEGKRLAALAPNIVIKLPVCEAGLAACRALADAGVRVNMTLVFSPTQALMAANAGARYISPFVGRFDDIAEDGISQLDNVVTCIKNYDWTGKNVDDTVEIITASVRTPNHVTQAALLGADIATVPMAALKKCLHHPLTDQGLASFEADWQKVVAQA